ncbi:MAG: hypothetical protein H0T51_24790 [Pirellulales bacterium]|nr:hypothetical protein [Pirellulales bacterium]
MKTSLMALAFPMLTLLFCHGRAGASNSVLYSDLASFSAAAGGPLQTQDFSGYAHSTNLRNVAFLPGVSVDSNMDSVQAFAAGDTSLFGLGGRDGGIAYYDVNFTSPHRAASFEITSFEAVPGNSSTAVDAGLLSVFFTDATSQSLPIAGNATGANIFFGIVSDTPISRIRWAEAHEGNGGNEETTLDNFRVVLVPEPGAAYLIGMALATTIQPQMRRRPAARHLTPGH